MLTLLTFLKEKRCLSDLSNQLFLLEIYLVNHDKFTNRSFLNDGSFKFLPYQLPTVGYGPTVAITGNGELGFDSGEGA